MCSVLCPMTAHLARGDRTARMKTLDATPSCHGWRCSKTPVSDVNKCSFPSSPSHDVLRPHPNILRRLVSTRTCRALNDAGRGRGLHATGAPCHRGTPQQKLVSSNRTHLCFASSQTSVRDASLPGWFVERSSQAGRSILLCGILTTVLSCSTLVASPGLSYRPSFRAALLMSE